MASTEKSPLLPPLPPPPYMASNPSPIMTTPTKTTSSNPTTPKQIVLFSVKVALMIIQAGCCANAIYKYYRHEYDHLAQLTSIFLLPGTLVLHKAVLDPEIYLLPLWRRWDKVLESGISRGEWLLQWLRRIVNHRRLDHMSRCMNWFETGLSIFVYLAWSLAVMRRIVSPIDVVRAVMSVVLAVVLTMCLQLIAFNPAVDRKQRARKIKMINMEKQHDPTCNGTCGPSGNFCPFPGDGFYVTFPNCVAEELYRRVDGDMG